MLDLKIRSANVVDGTGRPARRTDVGVRDGTIVSMGQTDEAARSVVDADGLVLAPGFVDVHTHYDAQLFWDPGLTPSPSHGVTTVLSGNCGFTLAPLHDGDEEFLTQMLCRVEGMPAGALQHGVPWNWRSVGEYLDRIRDLGTAVNVGVYCGHSTLRRYVMGERAGGPATEKDRVALVRALEEALEAGALGLSTSDSATHTDHSGNPVPSRFADDIELEALAGVLRRYPGTALQCVPPSGPYSDEVKDRLVRLSVAADRPINWNIIVVNARSGLVAQNRLEASDRALRRGGCVTGIVFPTLNRLRITFASGFYIDTIPGWKALFELPLAERARALADPDWRRRLRSSAETMRPDQRFVSRWSDYEVTDVAFGSAGDLAGRSIGELAGCRGTDPFDTLLDVVGEAGLDVGLSLPADGDDEPGWRMRAELAADPRLVVGGSDGGAHLDMMCGVGYTTAMLHEFPARGLMTVEEVVHQLTDVPARLFGLRGRGRVATGWRADLVLFDPDAVGAGNLEVRRDLPGGSARVVAPALGIHQVFVAGQSILATGVPTGARPGQVLRRGSDTVTVDNHAARTLIAAGTRRGSG